MAEGSPARDAWNAATELLLADSRLSSSQEAFVRMAHPLAVVDDIFMIAVGSEFVRNWITEHVSAVMSQQLSEIFGRELKLMISVDPSVNEEPAAAPPQPVAPTTQPASETERNLRVAGGVPAGEPLEPSYDVYGYTPEAELDDNDPSVLAQQSALVEQQERAGLNPRYTFDNFVIGESNKFAAATALAVSEAPGTSYNPLFLYSDSGMGKTHLLHAIGNYTLQLSPDRKVLYVSAEQFTNLFINALRDGKQSAFKDEFRTVDVLLIDDIQFMNTKDRTIEEFFHTFNALSTANKQIVITSDVAPKLLSGFEERMISRFASGITTNIDLPNLETRIAILDKKAASDNLKVPRDVIEFIASRMTTNVREMEGALRRVTAFADLSREPVSLEMAETVLKDMISDPGNVTISAAMIMAQVAGYFGIAAADLKSPARTRSLTMPRHIAMYLCREMTDLSLPKIAEVFNRRDHTTVLNALRKVEALMAERQAVFNQVSELTALIKNMAKEQNS
ncbi:chromosomal replication initiator protein [Arcanobacterium wilhelmae]|uniref:Chromosomal replication initiator protein DnaA n=1 Tax=Arcanobacterium wilhelmae TaxID=1803177 RepID=A0ABT9NB15_9ACTO|nr:chromosomal replication initiator protein DnaA [Arcanobacterium wilhelmae]MDP9800917.1 chromosomal replication initiator protein [Arcanobacterium wilhelmae]WFN90280.1 chromosomal replication initiator protein DnaA [Arcanobacterium wilhelmae]